MYVSLGFLLHWENEKWPLRDKIIGKKCSLFHFRRVPMHREKSRAWGFIILMTNQFTNCVNDSIYGPVYLKS